MSYVGGFYGALGRKLKMASRRRITRHGAIRLAALAACAVLTTALLPGQTASAARGAACDHRSNNTYEKLLDCVTLEGVREHQQALQKIADNSTDPVYPGTRAAGTEGYADSVDYVAGMLKDAGYKVTLDPVEVTFNFPAELRQLTPTQAEYETGVFTGSGSGTVRATSYRSTSTSPATAPRRAAANRRTSMASTSAAPPTSR